MSLCEKVLSSLNSIKSTQLQDLARALGLSITGTKSVLKTRLIASLPRGRFESQSGTAILRRGNAETQRSKKPNLHYVLSVDMGIRNLAYCLLGIDKSWLNATPDHHLYLLKPTVQVLQWQRLSLTTLLEADEQRTDGPVTDIDAIPAAPTHDESNNALPSVLRERFTPPFLAPVAVRILQNLVLQQARAAGDIDGPERFPKPTSDASPADTVLIEQQRWRSGGGAAVQEWTLRVNSLEAMLWGGLAMMRAGGLWTGSVHAVSPKAVARFWVPEGLQSGKKGKEAKIRVVDEWLAEGYAGSVKLSWTPHTEAMRRTFIGDGKTGKRRVKKGGVDAARDDVDAGSGQAVAKKDDLADCLLQGLAWVRWEENRRAILSGSFDTLHESGVKV